MEDRLNAGLMLVLFDRLSPASREEWQSRLAANDAVTRLSWWQNVCPNRADWLGALRTIAEFETLAICELEDVGRAIAPDDARAILFRRYPRPSQGVLRLPTMGLCLVLVSPKDLADEQSSQSLRDWADFVHFPGIVDANIPGYGLVTPYENVTRDAPRYMHLYEFPDPDAEAVFQRTRPCVAQRFGGGPGNPGFDHWELHPDIAINYVNSFSRMADDSSSACEEGQKAGSLAG
jgi:hypothetical protein